MNDQALQKAREIAAEVLRSEGVNPDRQARAYTDLLARVALRALQSEQEQQEGRVAVLEAALRLYVQRDEEMLGKHPTVDPSMRFHAILSQARAALSEVRP